MKIRQFELYLEIENGLLNQEHALRIVAVNLGTNGKKQTIEKELDRLSGKQVVNKVGDIGETNSTSALKEALRQSRLRKMQAKHGNQESINIDSNPLR